MAENDPFELWMATGAGEPPSSDMDLNEALRVLRTDSVTSLDLNALGPTEFAEDLEVELGMSPTDHLAFQALGIRTVTQSARMTPDLCTSIDAMVSNTLERDMDAGAVQQAASAKVEEREAQWAADDSSWLDDADVDAEMKEELTALNERARSDFDLTSLGGMALSTDSLQDLKGIGPKLELYLYAMGIRSYSQLAQLTPEIERKFDAIVGLFPGRLTRADVVGQAKVKLGLEEEA